MPEENRIQFYRGEAARLRLHAEADENTMIRDQLREIARLFEAVAEKLERVATVSPAANRSFVAGPDPAA